MLNYTQSLDVLHTLRSHSGPKQTKGLSDQQIEQFISKDSSLVHAIEQAHLVFQNMSDKERELCTRPEAELVHELQDGFLNFYSLTAVLPYVPLAAKGPWMVTSHGAVIYDTGGYGMLGLGHNPETVRQAMSEECVMANVMSPSFWQYRFLDMLRARIGFTRPDRDCPFDKFVCMNSGSEAMSVAARLCDINSGMATGPGGKHAGKTIKILSHKGSFHGRTWRPAQASDSIRGNLKSLASFRDRDNLITTEPNNVAALKKVFEQAEQDKVFIEAMFMEPVMGEGNPGQSITPEFYKTALDLCHKHDALLVVDSVQAGLRAHGVLSIVDYPGFEKLPPPDLESYSKAINAGQYPLSVLAMTERIAKLYKPGVYGNTMTTNPRALHTAMAVMDQVTPELAKNVRERGREMLHKLSALKDEFPKCIELVRGTGLLLCAELTQSIPVVGENNIEHFIRTKGVNVIHGGKNALRFTPHFWITSQEVDLIIDVVRMGLKEFRPAS